MGKYKIVVINPGYESYQIESEILAPLGADVIIAETDCTTEDLIIGTAHDADAILVREGPVTGNVIKSFEKLKIIARYGVGVDNIDLEAAKRKKIYVSTVPNYGNEEVSDHALALLLSCIRTLSIRDKNLRSGRFENKIVEEIHRTTGRILGIIGYGKIAQVLHRKWEGFLPSRVIVYDPFVDKDFVESNKAEKVDINTLLAESDYISIHAPLTPKTMHLIDGAALKRMKPTTIIVNTSRGAIVDTIALARALKNGQIFGAGIDVFEEEPLPSDHPLVSLPNVILTPHFAWYSKESNQHLQIGAAKEIRRVLSGYLPKNWVNQW